MNKRCENCGRKNATKNRRATARVAYDSIFACSQSEQ